MKSLSNPGLRRPAPLTRCNYRRTPEVERQIVEILSLDRASLVERARIADKNSAMCLAEEVLVYVIRRAHLKGDSALMNLLLNSLDRRLPRMCTRYFARYDQATRVDLIQEVLCRIAKDILAKNDRGDFAQTCFAHYLEARAIDVGRAHVKTLPPTEVLSLHHWKDEVNEEGETVESTDIADTRLNPEQRTLLHSCLSRLPPRLAEVYMLRVGYAIPIGPDNSEDENPDKPSLAAHYSVTGKTIRAWLHEAKKILAESQES